MIKYFLLSCGGSDSSSCTQEEKNSYLYYQMKDHYLWYNQVPNIDYRIYSSKPNQKHEGFGFGLKMADDNSSCSFLWWR